MANEQIDRLSIVVSARGAKSAADNLSYMTTALSSLEGVLPAVSANLVGLQAALNNSAGSISGYVASVKSALSGVVNEIESETSKMSEAMSSVSENEDFEINTDGIETASERIEEISANVEEAGKSWEYLNNPIAIVQSRIERLKGQVIELKQKWNDSSDIQAQERLQKKIEDTTMAINRQEKQLEKMRESANASAPTPTAMPDDEQPSQETGFDVGQVTALFAKFGLLNSKTASLTSSLAGLETALASVSTAALAVVGAIAAVVAIFKIFSKIVKTVNSTTKALGNGLVALGKRAIEGIKEKISSITEPISRIFDRIGRVVFNRLIREAFNIMVQGVVEGVKNVSLGVERANKIMSLYATRVMYLKNVMGSMLIPILQALYPVFINLTNAIIRASNAINQFSALLSGSSKWIKAKEVYVDYAESVDKSSKKAKKSVDKLTASFDELNDLTISSTADTDEEDMSAYFTDVGIEANISDFYKRLRAGFEKGDLSDVGTIVGNKINNAFRNLDSKIKWDNIGKRVENSMKALATFLVSAVSKIDFAFIGQTFADGLNTIFNALNAFVGKLLDEKFYLQLGIRVGQFLYTMLTTIDWEGIGTFFLDKLMSVFTFAKGFLMYLLQEVDVDGKSMTRIEVIVKNIFDGFTASLNKVDTGVIGEVVGNLIITIFTLGASIFEQSSFWESLAKAINDVIDRITANQNKITSSLKRFVTSAAKLVAFLLKNIDYKELINALSDVIDDVMNDPETRRAIQEASGALGELAGKWWSIKFKIKLSSLSTIVSSWLGTIAGFLGSIFGGVSSNVLTTIAFGKKKGFATGGFPEDGIFSANHKELVGTFSNGKTAVANNTEITQGIYKAVRDAMADAGTANGSGGSDIYLDSTKVGKAVAKGVFKEGKRAGYTLRTT